jgi:hypothetical protein
MNYMLFRRTRKNREERAGERGAMKQLIPLANKRGERNKIYNEITHQQSTIPLTNPLRDREKEARLHAGTI